MRRPMIGLVALMAAGAFGQALTKYANVQAITGERLRAHLEFVANDLLEGRDTPSRGLDLACWYVATQLKLWGAKPAGDDGTYFQKIQFGTPAVDLAATSVSINGNTLQLGKDCLVRGVGKAEGGLVFVGFGTQAKSVGIDSFANVDARGKVVVMLSGTPTDFSRDVRSGKITDSVDPITAAKNAGAVGVIMVPSDTTRISWDRVAKGLGQPNPARGPQSSPKLPVVVLNDDATRGLFTGEPVTGDEILKMPDAGLAVPSFSMRSEKRANFTIATTGNPVTAMNVVAIIPGSDPKLAKEYVAIGAHIDHLGMRGNGPGDTIFNGADDDGSGTVSILEIAHAFATGPRPKRSILFVWHCGEEKGLIGSRYFVDHPTVPIESIVTQLNIDMIGRSRAPGDTKPANSVLTGPDSIYVVGSRKLSSELGAINDGVNADLYKIGFDLKYDDPKDPENIYRRSDHFSYAAKMIPIIFFFDGVHEDYHQVSDEVGKIDFRKMERVARTVYGTAWTVGNRATRPKVDGHN